MPYLALVGTIWPPRLSQPAWGEMLFLALGSTVAGMLLWNRAIVRGGTRISRLLYLEPVVSVLGAMVFLGERATAAVLAGGVLVIAGVLVTGDSATGGKPDERGMVGGSGSAARTGSRHGRPPAPVAKLPRFKIVRQFWLP